MNSDFSTKTALMRRFRQFKWELSDRAGKQFRSAVVPIFGARENGTPMHIGSATLIEVSSVKLLLTAAHVLDENKVTSLYVGAGGKLVPLQAEFWTTKRVLRALDHFDFAFTPIAEALLPSLGGRCIPESSHMPGISSDPMRIYTALGFPNSKNKDYDNARVVAKAADYSYSGVHRPISWLSKKLTRGGEYHLQIKYEERSTDESGAIVDSFSPRGLSGGPVIDAGNPASPLAMLGRSVPIPRIFGITIELKHQRLIVVRLDAILPAIRKTLGGAQ